MIYKFEGIDANINRRDNIFVLIDEAHRTTSGNPGNYLMVALPNATYIGFTGTPIDKTSHGKGTFIIFGKDDSPLGYLDKYSIAESIEEGTTVPLHYSLASNELIIDKDLLENEFLNLKESEGLSDQEELNKILEKAVNLKNAIKSRNRIEKTAEYIAKHYQNYVEPLGYKAFVVAVDREACAIYKEELDKFLPSEYSKVVYSTSQNDPEFVVRHYLSEEEEKRIRKDFITPNKFPKILIVTNKLLTGFDAPILYCMYLDKPMRDHVLLQTIARVNRPYEDRVGRRKPAGLIIDFIGIFSNLEKALAFDSADIEGIVNDINKLKSNFEELINLNNKEYAEIKDFFKKLNELKTADKKIDFILDYFFDEEKRKKYYQLYKNLTDIYNIISPDEFLRPYLEKINLMTRIFKIIKESYDPSLKIDRDITQKIEKLVKDNVYQSDIKDSLDIYEINEEILEKLEKIDISDQRKIFNLTKSISKIVDKEGNISPFLIHIGERAEKIINLYKERQISTQKALEEIKKLIEEINKAKREQIEKNLDNTEFSIYYILNHKNISEPIEIARKLKKLIDEYPHWKSSASQFRELKQQSIKILLTHIKDVKEITELINLILKYLSI